MIRINANDLKTPESVIRVCKFMIHYWKTYNKDILIDMIGVRKHGHNEVDEPSFTQPHMYSKIRAMKSLGTLYAERLVSEGVITQEEINKIVSQIVDHFEKEFVESQKLKPDMQSYTNPKHKGSRAYTHKWEGIVPS